MKWALKDLTFAAAPGQPPKPCFHQEFADIPNSKSCKGVQKASLLRILSPFLFFFPLMLTSEADFPPSSPQLPIFILLQAFSLKRLTQFKISTVSLPRILGIFIISFGNSETAVSQFGVQDTRNASTTEDLAVKAFST